MNIEIIGFSEELATHFTALNMAWLQKYFVVEPLDEKMLSDPKKMIIDKNGFIFFAKINGQVAGTFAILKENNNSYELSKMAVDEEFRGLGIGNRMIEFFLHEVKRLNGSKAVLYSNTRLEPAIHLYKKFGFKEVALDHPEYARANIKMEINLISPMNSIQQLFSDKKKNILSIYFTAGFPQIDDTEKILTALQEHGADMIEIGMPYSDPLADGPVIQNSSMKALQNGMTIKLLFAQLASFRRKSPPGSGTGFPLILMGYLNPVLQYGFEKFCTDAKNAGITGIILPDLPINEYENEYKRILDQNDLAFIFLITPETSDDRIRKIDSISNGFIYAVSSSSITGSDTNMDAQVAYFQRIRNMKLENKVLIGFGIKDHRTFSRACEYAEGAIIGTAYIKAIEHAGNIDSATASFLNSILHS